MHRLKQGALVALAVVTCPCHAVLLLALLAGTGLGAAIAAHTGALVGALALVFLGAVVGLFRANQTPAPQSARGAESTPEGPQGADCCAVPGAPTRASEVRA